MPHYAQTVNSLFLCLFVPFKSTCIGWEMIFSTQDTDSNVNLFGNTLIDIPRNNVLPAISASLSPVKLTQNYVSQVAI